MLSRIQRLSMLMLCMFLTSCGGSGSEDQNASVYALTVDNLQGASEAFTYLNVQRSAMGANPFVLNSQLTQAALTHARYQALKNTISHFQTDPLSPYFTGVGIIDRLHAAGYLVGYTPGSYLAGEGIALLGQNTSGIAAIDLLIAAPYHRLNLLSPTFIEAGIGTANNSAHSTITTINMTTGNNSLPPPAILPSGQVLVWPYAGQTNTPRYFFSDTEEPDPAPDQNLVGYPITVHADLWKCLLVTSFTVNPLGGVNLGTHALNESSGDAHVHLSGAAMIVPLTVLQPHTTYAVHFVGEVVDSSNNVCNSAGSGAAISKDWQFSTGS